MSIFRTFIELKKSYVETNKREANVLYVTPRDEYEILSSFEELPDTQKAKVMSEGVRSAFPRIFGMRTVWDADQTKVDVESPLPVGFR
jgi:hypothetical protein